jgi:outer membrane protein TolC
MQRWLRVWLAIMWVLVVSAAWNAPAWAQPASSDDQIDEVYLDEEGKDAEATPVPTAAPTPEAAKSAAMEPAPEEEPLSSEIEEKTAPEPQATPAPAQVVQAHEEEATKASVKKSVRKESDQSEEQFLEEEAGIAPEERAVPQQKETKKEDYEVMTPEGGQGGGELATEGTEEAPEEGKKAEIAEVETAMTEAEKIPSILTTLEECKRVALLNDRRVQVAIKQMKYEQFKVMEAERAFLPQAKGTYEQQDGAAAGQNASSPDTKFNGMKYGLEGEEILFQGGKLVYTLRQSQNNLEVAKKKYQQAKQEVIQKVEKAYYNLVKSQMIFEVQTDLSKAAESALAFSREAYRQGLNSYHEFLNVQSQTDQTYYQLMSYQQDITLAELALRQACNVDSSIGVQIDAVLTFTDFNFNYSLDECLELAFKNRPDLAVNELTTLSDYYGIKIAMAENWPKITFNGMVGKDGQVQQGQPFTLSDAWTAKIQGTWMIGANTAQYSQEKKVTIPKTYGTTDNTKSSLTQDVSLAFFDKLENFSNVAKARVQQATTEADLVELRGKVANEVEENYFNYQKAMTMVTASLSKIKFREKDLEINRAKQMMDDVPLSTVLTSELQLGEERVNYVKALADYYIAISGLFKAMGLAK